MQFCTPPPKKSPKDLNQNWDKCCMKVPIRQVLLQTSLFIVQFSKRYLKTPSWDFLIKNQLQTDAFVAFGKYLSSVPSTGSLNTVTWQRSLQQGFCSRRSQMVISNDFVLYRIVIRKGTLNLTENSFLLEPAVPP